MQHNAGTTFQISCLTDVAVRRKRRNGSHSDGGQGKGAFSAFDSRFEGTRLVSTMIPFHACAILSMELLLAVSDNELSGLLSATTDYAAWKLAQQPISDKTFLVST